MEDAVQSLSLTEEGIRIEGPLGAVLLRRRDGTVQAEYIGDQLANGSVECYVRELTRQAGQMANSMRLPWDRRSDGSVRIQDHARFYEDSFRPATQAYEALRTWMDSADAKR